MKAALSSKLMVPIYQTT